jgi:hypothetical protein
LCYIAGSDSLFKFARLRTLQIENSHPKNRLKKHTLWVSISISFLFFRFQLEQPARRGGNGFVVISNLFRQEGLLQVPVLYLLEEIGVLFEVHDGLVLGDDNADLPAGAEFSELGGNRGQVAIPGKNTSSVEFVRYRIGKDGNGDVYVGFLLLMGLIATFTEGAFAFPEVELP